MSIILKGIDLPNGPIKLVLYPSGKVDEYVLNERIATDYQAIQIPTPHGRLIDGGELYKDFENHCGGECDCCVHETENYNCGLIANAPTILESEE